MNWNAISTAPRDGSNILIRFGSDGVSQAKYIIGLPHPWQFIDTNDGITWVINHAIDGPGGPSHWMPMPALLATKPAQGDPILNFTKELYAYLESTCPSGFADEAYRVAPEAVRAAIDSDKDAQGHIAGVHDRSAPEVGFAGREVAKPSQDAPASVDIRDKQIADETRKMVALFYGEGIKSGHDIGEFWERVYRIEHGTKSKAAGEGEGGHE